MPDYEDYYERAVKKLIYHHCHSDDRCLQIKIVRLLADGLDYDQAEELLQELDTNLSFVHTGVDEGREKVWLIQNRECVEYIVDTEGIKLDNVGAELDHLKPPELRQEFGIINVR